MKSKVLHTVWCNISGEAAGKILNWSLSGSARIKRFIEQFGTECLRKETLLKLDSGIYSTRKFYFGKISHEPGAWLVFPGCTCVVATDAGEGDDTRLGAVADCMLRCPAGSFDWNLFLERQRRQEKELVLQPSFAISVPSFYSMYKDHNTPK